MIKQRHWDGSLVPHRKYDWKEIDCLKELIQNERGNTVLFIIGMFSILTIFIFVVFILGSALTVKEKSATTVQQASLAATSGFYEEVERIIIDVEGPRIIDELKERLEQLERALEAAEDPSVIRAILAEIAKVKKALDLLENFITNIENIVSTYTAIKYSQWSKSEKYFKAFGEYLNNQVFEDELIGSRIKSALRSADLESIAIFYAKKTIIDNDGELEDAELKIKNNRIHIYASNQFKSESYRVIDKIKKNIFQEANGPEIIYLNEVWVGSHTYKLDIE